MYRLATSICLRRVSSWCAIWFGANGPFGRYEPIVLGIVLGILRRVCRLLSSTRFPAENPGCPTTRLGSSRPWRCPSSLSLWGMAGLTAVVTAADRGIDAVARVVR